ncbi:hypothetical protein [Methylobacterium frigidaeris]|nr:hypothetical protein [Methylobacterium frigidaeris]
MGTDQADDGDTGGGGEGKPDQAGGGTTTENVVPASLRAGP